MLSRQRKPIRKTMYKKRTKQHLIGVQHLILYYLLSGGLFLMYFLVNFFR